MRKSRKRKTGNAEIFRHFANVLLFLLPFFLIYLCLECVIHPRRHPRLYAVVHEIQHRHPRLAKSLGCAPFVVVVGGQLLVIAAVGAQQRRLRVRGRLSKPPLRIAEMLGQTAIVKTPLLPNVAWTLTTELAQGLCVEAPDVRTTHWELVSMNDRRREMVLELRYTGNPLGAKQWQVYPRRLTCRLTLKGKSVRSELHLRFTADSPMNYANVEALIADTSRQLELILAPEKAPKVVA